MEASSAQQNKEKEQRVHRPYAFDKMEGLVREMQDPENGVPVRSQKLFLTSIPSAFMGYDLIEWLMERLNIEESVEAVHIANQLCQYGYYFPVNDSRTLTVKDDSSLYRFQTPYYWPWQHRIPDNVEYAIYLAKRTLRNKQRHGLEEYEVEALTSLKRNLQNKWDIIQLQAEEQVRLSKERKKGDKIVSDSQERAFWRVYRPPPGCSSSLEVVPIPTRARPGLPRAPPRKRTLNDLQREVELLRNSVTRTRIKVSAAIENLRTHFETFMEYDPMMTQPQPSNPWITDDQTFWQLYSPLVEVPTEKRVRRWGLSMEEVMSDHTALQEFTNYLRKEYSHENIRFWLAVKDLRHSYQAKINDKVNEIFKEFLAPGAPCEINIDGKTMEKVHQEMKNPSRFTFDSAAEHVYTLLLKKDCYPRFIRSDHYRNLLAAGVQPLQKKRFFGFGGQGKKKAILSAAPTGTLSQQQQQSQHTMMGGRRRGSDRSLSGSAHELAICSVRDTVTTPRVPHSHSQSNLTDIPYRDASGVGGGESSTSRPMDDVCPWEEAPAPEPSKSQRPQQQQQQPPQPQRKNSTQLDSCSSSSDVSSAIAEVSERLRKSGPGQQQQQQQQQPTPGIQRNYSVGSGQPRVKLAETTRASVSTCNFPSPQHSFDLSYVPTEHKLQHQASAAAELTPSARAVDTVPEEAEHSSPQPQPPRSTAKAPLISISAIVGDLPEELEPGGTEEETTTLSETPDTSSDCAQMSEPLTQAQSVTEVEDELSKPSTSAAGQARPPSSAAPAAKAESAREPDARADKPEQQQQQQQQQQASTSAATQPGEQQPGAQPAPSKEQRDNNNVNEVCPWEDEENCRVDAPYVKTYATLGYL